MEFKRRAMGPRILFAQRCWMRHCRGLIQSLPGHDFESVAVEVEAGPLFVRFDRILGRHFGFWKM